jgi:hypothetical protein
MHTSDEFLIDSINSSMERSQLRFADAVTEELTIRKIEILCSTLGELQGELAFVRRELKRRQEKSPRRFLKIRK